MFPPGTPNTPARDLLDGPPQRVPRQGRRPHGRAARGRRRARRARGRSGARPDGLRRVQPHQAARPTTAGRTASARTCPTTTSTRSPAPARGKPFDCNKLVNRSGTGHQGARARPASRCIWYPYGVGKDFPEMSEAWDGGTDGGRLAIPGPEVPPVPGQPDAAVLRRLVVRRRLDAQLDQAASSSTTKGNVLRIQRFAPGRGLAGADRHGPRRRRLAVRARVGRADDPVRQPARGEGRPLPVHPACGTCDPTIPPAGCRDAGARRRRAT